MSIPVLLNFYYHFLLKSHRKRERGKTGESVLINQVRYFRPSVVPSGDEHQSEYTAPSDERLSWLTGFNGSVGTAIVERDRGAWLFVDSR